MEEEPKINSGEGQESIDYIHYLENARHVGDSYVTVINRISGKGQDNIVNLQSIPNPVKEKLNLLVQAVEKRQLQQEGEISEKNIGAIELLQQLAGNEDTKETLSKNSDKYQLQKLSPGVYMVLIESNFYKQALGNNAASAYIPKKEKDISFILCPNFKDKNYMQNVVLAVSIPHESHHIAWNFAKREGVITTTEKDSEWQNAFLMFQDELMARLVAGQKPMGYHRPPDAIPVSISDEVEQLLRTNNEKFNNLLEEIDDLREIGSYKHSDFIMATIIAMNFEELEKNLLELKQVLSLKNHSN